MFFLFCLKFGEWAVKRWGIHGSRGQMQKERNGSGGTPDVTNEQIERGGYYVIGIDTAF